MFSISLQKNDLEKYHCQRNKPEMDALPFMDLYFEALVVLLF